MARAIWHANAFPTRSPTYVPGTWIPASPDQVRGRLRRDDEGNANASGLAEGWGYSPREMMGNGSGMFFGGGLMWLFWFLVIAALAWLVVALVRDSSDRESKSKSAIEILEERFARGEIDRDELEEKREALRRH